MPNICSNDLKCIPVNVEEENEYNIIMKFYNENKEGDDWLGTANPLSDYNTSPFLSDATPYATYRFDSAWSPPCNRGSNDWLKNKSKQYPNIRFEIMWTQEEDDWWGEEHYINGDIVYDSYEEGDSLREQRMKNTDGNNAYNSIDLDVLYPNGFNEEYMDGEWEQVIYSYLTEDNDWDFDDWQEDLVEHIMEKVGDDMLIRLQSKHKIHSFLILTKYKINKCRKEVKNILSNKLPIELSELSSDYFKF